MQGWEGGGGKVGAPPTALNFVVASRRRYRFKDHAEEENLGTYRRQNTEQRITLRARCPVESQDGPKPRALKPLQRSDEHVGMSNEI